MKFEVYKADQRGTKDLEWLKSHFTFSFSTYANPVRAGFELLRVFNDDFVAPKSGFGLHPHANMEIISIMLAGAMSHADSLGYREVVKKDWVQLMSAGSGLRHEEHNVGEEEVNFLQIWIEPKLQNISPRYQRRYFPEENRLNQLVTIVSGEEGSGHCWINANARLSLGYFEQDRQLSYSFNPLNKGIFVFTISGTIGVNGQTLDRRDAIGLWETEEININCLATSRFLVVEVPINH